MIAPEGFGTLAIFIILALAAAFFAWKKPKWYSYATLVVFVLLLGLVTYFFRNPEITLPPGDMIVSPCTGTIVEITTNPDGSTHLAMFLSIFDVHAIRMTASGKIRSAKHFPGKFHPAYKPEAGRENEHVRIELETEHGVIVTRVLAGLVARRIVCHLNSDGGENVVAGQRVGFIRFGSRSEIDFPPGFEFDVKVGDHVKGGIDKLGKFISRPASE